jgi:hypothetical protein
MDETKELLRRCRDFSSSAFVLVASEAGLAPAAVKKEYQKATRDPQAQTAEDIYRAAQTVHDMIAHEVERRAIRPRQEPPPKETAQCKAKRLKKVPEYNPENGYVGAFALRALADRLIDEKKYKSIEEIDKAAAERRYCNRGRITAAYRERRDCTGRTYEGLARLVLEHDGNLSTTHEVRIRFLKFPEPWSPTTTYVQGQLITCPDSCIAVVTRKLPHQNIEARRLDGETRQYKEAMPPTENRIRRHAEIISGR